MNLLLIRGLIRDQRCWGDFPERLRHHAPHLKIYFLDLPGVGTENERPSPASIPAIRIDLAKRFHENIARGKFPKGPWSLLAISMGGMISLDWVDAEPDLFEKLIIINTSSRDVAGVFERLNPKVILNLLKAFLTTDLTRSENQILSAVSNRYAKHDPKMEELLLRQVSYRKERPVARATFIRQITSAANYHLPRNRPKSKTVFISSNGDRMVAPICSTRLAERFGAELISHPWAGHDIPIDDPDWLARETIDWMETAR